MDLVYQTEGTGSLLGPPNDGLSVRFSVKVYAEPLLKGEIGQETINNRAEGMLTKSDGSLLNDLRPGLRLVLRCADGANLQIETMDSTGRFLLLAS